MKLHKIVLIIGILISFLIGIIVYSYYIKEEQYRFNEVAKKIVVKLEDRVKIYREILYGGLALFEANNGNVTREQWAIYIKQLKLKDNFPGIQGVGYSIVLQEDELDKNIAQIRSEGFSNYKIYPEGKRDLYTSIIYLEPFDWRNVRAFGYDMYSEQTRKFAMQYAIETGNPSLSGKVRLVQENGKDEQAGFLLYLPHYKANMPLDTKENRYKAIKGFIYSPFRAKDFMLGIVENTLDQVSLKLYDKQGKNEEKLLFDSQPLTKTLSRLEYVTNLNIDNHVWTLKINPLNSFENKVDKIYPFIFTFIGILLSFLYSSKLKQNEDILEMHDDALHNISQGVIVTNENQRIIYVNNAFEELTGYTKKEIYGKKPNILQGIDSDIDTMKFIKHKLMLNESCECEIINYKKDGSKFWNQLSITPIFENTEVIRYIAILNDITNKKLADEDILFEKNFLTNILENTNAVIAVIDRDGVMIRLNKYGQNFVGYTQQEVASKAYFWSRFLNENIKNKVFGIIEQARNGVIVESFQNSWISKYNEERVFEWSNALVNNEYGQMKYIITVGIDITKQKEVEYELIQNEKILKQAKEEAERANRIKSQFLANMSHEIRTPLNGIVGFINLLKKAEKDEKKLSYINMVRRSSNSLIDIINDILDISKIEDGKLSIEHTVFNLYQELDDILTLYANNAKDKNIKLKLVKNDDTPNFIKSDSLRFRQVLANLISNAIKFSKKNSSITVSVKYKEEYLYVSVSDLGIGIPKDAQKRIFEPFEQENNSTTRTFGGTGLGLAISKELVELMGGEISLESTVDKGSTFSFYISAPKADDISKEKKQKKEYKFKGHILVAEDNKTNQLLIDILLKDMNLTCKIVEDGKEAVEEFNKDTYDLILMDITMPNMDGIEATKIIREYSDIPIIALTANSMKDDIEYYFEMGMNSFVPKPIKVELLGEELSKYLIYSS
ncbi:PAS domain S-box protein [Sulfurimonas lithotrophica]|uniref:Sensory/regulatory protein RpfC n=1 Tax=Sulfurimonas lithotrophica TaxID=2590022 RepID=A0A5P8NZG1_9BACT|nr:CHASE domain-containing protein [Sulfurimonas lithotrophica]QFR48845.1 PAS domain S-box protein [Sulfurimonas lithotrophica]